MGREPGRGERRVPATSGSWFPTLLKPEVLPSGAGFLHFLNKTPFLLKYRFLLHVTEGPLSQVVHIMAPALGGHVLTCGW